MVIKEIEVDGEKIYFKKSGLLGWHIIHPYRIDGRISWKNLIAGGSWIKLGLIIGFILLLLLAIQEVSNIIRIANQCINNSNQFLLYP